MEEPAPPDASACAVAALLHLLPAAGEHGGEDAVRLAQNCGSATWLATGVIGTLAHRRSRIDAVSPTPGFAEVLGAILG